MLPVAAGTAGVVILALLQFPMYRDVGGIFDFWPLYHGARAWLQTGDAYWSDPSLPDLGQLSTVGNVYPLHAALLLGMPFAVLPPGAAGALWVALLGLAWIAAIRWARESWYWLLWIPMWDALRIQQMSAAIGVAAIVAMGALKRNSAAPFVVAIVVLSMKPQQTLVLILFMLWWGRRWWKATLTTACVVAGLTFAAQPDWVARWLAQVALRSDMVPTSILPSLLAAPLAAWLVMRGWRESGLAVASTATAPWPELGYYVTTAWPVGCDRQQGAWMAFVGLLGFMAAMLRGYWAFPYVLIVGLALAALLTRRTRVPLHKSPQGT